MAVFSVGNSGHTCVHHHEIESGHVWPYSQNSAYLQALCEIVCGQGMAVGGHSLAHCETAEMGQAIDR
jgi:hypothetical protein